MATARNSGHILLVDDDPSAVYLMKRALKSAGVTNSISVVEDGQGAIDYLLGRDDYADRSLHPLPYLVLLDVSMPRRSGLEVLAEIRRRPDLQHTPVIMLSSSDDQADIRHSYALRANAYVIKPMTFDELVAITRTAMDYWLSVNLVPAPREPATSV